MSSDLTAASLEHIEASAGQAEGFDAAAAGSAGFKTQLARFVELENERRDLELRLDAVKGEAGKLQAALIEQFADMGMQNAKVGDLTVYVRTDRYVSKRADVETETVCAALRDCGLGYMVADGYNPQSLKSKIKEYQDQGIEVPESLAALLNIGETPRLATRKA